MPQVPGTDSGSMFCGKLLRLSNQTVPASKANYARIFVRSIKNQCFVNYQYLWPHVVIIPVLLLALLYIKTWGRIDRSPNYRKKYQLTFPLHAFRCSVFIVLILVQLLNFGEGVVTDMEIQGHLPTQPQLYLPPFLATLATIVAAIYYQKMEVWNKPSGLGILLIYWLWSLFIEVVRLINLSYDEEFGIGVMRLQISMILTILYVLLIGIECHVYAYQSRFGRNNLTQDIPDELFDGTLQYLNEYSNLYSKRFLLWMKPFFDLSIKRALELKDLGDVPKNSQSQKQCERIEAEIQKQRQQDLDRGITKPTTRLVPVLLNIYGWDIALAVIIRIVTSPSTVATSLLVKGILNYISVIQHGGFTTVTHNATVEEFFRNGFVLAFCLGIVSLSFELLSNHGSTLLSHSIIPARSGLQAVINQKALRMSTGKLPESNTEEEVTSGVIFEDMNNIFNGMTCLPTVFGTPCLLIFNAISLCQLLGPSSILAFFIIILTYPLPEMILKEYSKILPESKSRADERLKITKETIAGIKVVKLFGWEEIFFEKIKAVRDQQVSVLRKGLIVGGLLIPGWTVGGTLATITALGMYSLFHGGRPLIPDVTFPALILLSSTASQVVSLPSALRICFDAKVSIKRLQQYLDAPEVGSKTNIKASMIPGLRVRPEGGVTTAPEKVPLLEPQYGTFSYNQLDEELISSELAFEEGTALPDEVAIRIKDGSFTWNPDDVGATLNDINIDIPIGKFTMIFGEEGSGKSLLLSAMLGETQTISGDVIRNKNMNSAALVDKVPWIQNATLKDNIIFGIDEDEHRYSEVIRCCGLRHDISILPAGDDTKIGEEGINLTDEQNQRISIGRALYSAANIIFLDNPFTVLDSQVGDDLFKEGFEGLLRKENRSIIMVTRQMKYIEKADYIIMMKEGAIHVHGSPDQIQEAHPDLWQMWLEMSMTDMKEEEAENEESERKTQEDRLRLFRQISENQKVEQMMSFISSLEDPDEEDSSKEVTLAHLEEVKSETVEWSVYFNLVKMAGILIVVILIIAVIILQAFETGSHFWLRYWSQTGLESIEQGKSEYFPAKYFVTGYTVLAMGSIVFCFLVGFLVFWAALRVGALLHTISLTSVIRSPLRFFDTTPRRQIMNRFSVDLHTIDHELGLQITMLIMTTIAVVNGIIINIILAGFFSVPALLPFLGFSFLVMKYYLMVTRDIKRLESISLSPVRNHYTETLAGLRTIRAYAYQTQQSTEFFMRIDQRAIVSLFQSSAGVWLASHLALVNNTMFTVLSCILIGMAKSGTLATSAVGLGLASIINFTTIVNNAADIDMSMTAAERLCDYDNLPVEEYDGIVDPPAIWPDQGEIVIHGLCVRYDEELEPVLRDVCLDVKPREKIGIGGGKGSGKSSLALSLFRTVDIFAGNIYIDGMNVKHIPLIKLRHRLAIVPQEPFLFTGSIRFNLDPFGNLMDNKLWEALEIVELKTVVKKLHGELDATVSEGGENFSVGQRQLLCLARAILKDTKILIMDEPTASIDEETSAIIRKIVASAFDQRTVITIAHRAAMILGADRVVVLKDGRVVENDTPINLLQGGTLFTSLVQQKHDPVGIVIHSKECSCGH